MRWRVVEWVGQNRENDEEDDGDCVEEGSVGWGKILQRWWGREALGMKDWSINIWDRSELKLAWSKKSSSCFENNFPMFLLSGF